MGAPSPPTAAGPDRRRVDRLEPILQCMERVWVWPTPARWVASIPRCVTGSVQVRRCSVGSRSARSWCDRPAKRRSASSTSPSVSSSSSSTTSSSRATCWPSQSSTVLFSGSTTSASLSRGRSCRRDVACLSRVMRVTSLSAVCHTTELRPRRRGGRRRPGTSMSARCDGRRPATTGTGTAAANRFGARTAAAGLGHPTSAMCPDSIGGEAGPIVRGQKTRRYDEHPWHTVGGRGVSRADRNRR
jgi:hypothetical protein